MSAKDKVRKYLPHAKLVASYAMGIGSKDEYVVIDDATGKLVSHYQLTETKAWKDALKRLEK